MSEQAKRIVLPRSVFRELQDYLFDLSQHESVMMAVELEYKGNVFVPEPMFRIVNINSESEPAVTVIHHTDINKMKSDAHKVIADHLAERDTVWNESDFGNRARPV